MKKPSDVRDFLVAAMDRFFEGDGGFSLAAGEPKAIEIARSGTFVGMGGKKVTFTPGSLLELAGRFDLSRDHKVKIGHEKVTTSTPDYGDVQALAYDAEKDRLFATIDPSEALVEKNRKERFRRVSMELSVHPEGGYDFEDVSFLGAHRPAISGLTPVELAEADSTEERKAFVFAVDETPDPEQELFEVGLAATPAPAEEVETEDESKGLDKAGTETESTDKEQKQMDEKQTAQLARLMKQAKDGAADRVSSFLAANTKKIPMKVRKAGLETGLIALLSEEAVADEPTVIKFASVDEKGVSTEQAETPGQFVMRMLAAMPEQVSTEQKSETTVDGNEEEDVNSYAPQFAAFIGETDPEGDTKAEAAYRLMEEEQRKGNTIDFATAARRVVVAKESKSGRR